MQSCFYIYSTTSSTRPVLDKQKSNVSTSSSQASSYTRGEMMSASTKEIQGLAKALALSVAFAANVGGIATLTGTPPNLVLKGMADE